MSDATPKAANKAWNKWHDFRALDQFYDRPSPMFLHAFAAGQVAALEEAQGATRKCPCSEECDVERPVFIAHMRDWLRDRAAELSKEQHDQPDP